MELPLVELPAIDAVERRVGAHVRQRDRRRLAHHVAELAGQRGAARAGIARRLDEEHVAADARHGQASGDAGHAGAFRDLIVELGAAEILVDLLDADGDRRGRLARSEPCGGLAQERPERALERADARLARVLAQHLADRVLRDRRLVIQQPVLGALAWHEVAGCDRDLLVVGVAVELEDLEAVVERVRDLVGHVGRGDEQHLREIDFDVEVVVAERRVLRGVEHLEERRRRVATEVGAELVDLVEQDHGVHRSGIAQGPHEAARHRADIGAAMAADFGLVANATERDAHELATEGVCDRLAEGGLADAGRSDQREDHAALAVFDVALLAELAHGEVLDDALLDVVEAGVVGIEDRACALDVARLLAVLAPRQLEQRVEVRADGGRLRALRACLETIELTRCLLPCLVAQLGLVDLGAVAGDLVALLAFELTELLADRVELAAQEELTLRLLHALVDVLADALAHGDLGQHVAQPGGHLGQALGDVDRLEQLELALVGEVGREARSVGERAGLIDLAEHRDDTTVAARLEDLLDDAAVLAR